MATTDRTQNADDASSRDEYMNTVPQESGQTDTVPRRDPWSERAVSLAAAVRPDIQDRDMGERKGVRGQITNSETEEGKYKRSRGRRGRGGLGGWGEQKTPKLDPGEAGG